MKSYIEVVTLDPQPVQIEYKNGWSFWQWKDCRWVETGIGFPRSGIQDHSPHQIGDVFCSHGKNVKVVGIDVDRIKIMGKKQWAWIFSTIETDEE